MNDMDSFYIYTQSSALSLLVYMSLKFMIQNNYRLK